MGCSVIGSAVNPILIRMNRVTMERNAVFEGNMGKRLQSVNRISFGESRNYHAPWRLLCTPVSLEEEFSALQLNKFSKDDELEAEGESEEILTEPPSSEELKALLADSERSKLIKKLSEANQQNRLLKRKLQASEDDLFNFRSDLAAIELEIQASTVLAQEIAHYAVPEGSRKIKGKYIQSHLLARLEAVQKMMAAKIMHVKATELRGVSLFWSGMAESVQLMGSFDDWTLGEHLSPEYTGLHTTFSATMKLRPGRYEIKFLVDGQWQLSPEYPAVGEEPTKNNVLIIE